MCTNCENLLILSLLHELGLVHRVSGRRWIHGTREDLAATVQQSCHNRVTEFGVHTAVAISEVLEWLLLPQEYALD